MGVSIELVRLSAKGAGDERYALVETSWGWLAFACRGEVMTRLFLPRRRRSELVESVESELPSARQDEQALAALQKAIEAYFCGEQAVFDCQVDVSGVSDFSGAVLRGCCEIAVGQTLSYGELADRAGRPKAARAVGAVMRENRTPLVIPCHRVVGADGRLGGYSGVGGVGLKARLLEHEKTMRLR